MRPFSGLLAIALALAASLVLGSHIILSPKPVHATNQPAPAAAGGNCQESEQNRPWPRAKYADAAPADSLPQRKVPSIPRPPQRLDASDELAALEAVHLALSELGDGASYVWHRRNGRLSGIINPTSSFKDPQGRVCRHLVLTLTAGSNTARTEGVACRLENKSWRLEG